MNEKFFFDGCNGWSWIVNCGSVSEEMAQMSNMGSHNIEVVCNFIYLGSEVTSDNNTSVEVKRRTWMGKMKYVVNYLRNLHEIDVRK